MDGPTGLEVAFLPLDDGLVEGVHTVDVSHSVVATGVDISNAIFSGTVQIEIAVKPLSHDPRRSPSFLREEAGDL
jgi:hypothetical protein